MNKKKIIYLSVVIISVSLVFSVFIWYFKNLKMKSNINLESPNSIAIVTTKNLPILIKVNGTVEAIKRINISPESAGKISKLYVDEGDIVQKVQLIARMENQQIQSQVNQYKAIVQESQANLDYIKAGARPEEIAQAKAKLNQAEARFANAKTGASLEEIAQVQARVDAAQAEADLAQNRVKRYRKLQQEGAISEDLFNELLQKEHSTKAILSETKRHLAELSKNRQSSLRELEAEVEQARQNLKQLENGARKEEIAKAKANLEQATAQLRYYEIQLAKTLLYAPFNGTITRRFAQEGDFVTPTTTASVSDGATSTSIVELSSGLEIEAKVPEASIAPIKIKQGVIIASDVYPNHRFNGYVRLVIPRAIRENNVTSFRVKIALQTGHNKLKPGMNVKLTIWAGRNPNNLVVPIAAVMTKNDGQTGVFVIDQKNQVEFRPITIGLTIENQVEIIQGVSQGERILLEPPPDMKIPEIDNVHF